MNASAAIVGMGCVSAYGLGVEAAWDKLLRNERAPEIMRSHLGRTSLAMLAPSIELLSEQVPSSGLSRPTRPTLLARLAAEEAWRSAGELTGVAPERAGLLINRNFGQHQIIGQYYETLWTKGPSGASGLQFVQTIANSVLGSLAIQLKLRGPSSMHFGPPAIGAALDQLRSDSADVMVAGGMDELSEYVSELCYRARLSCCAGSSGGAGQPYSSSSHGLIPGEGSVFFVLERSGFVSSRSAKPLAYLKGFGTVTDSLAWKNPAERSTDDIAEAIRRSLVEANVDPDEVVFISGAANGVSSIDSSELAAISAVFPHRPAIFSIKGGIGEMWGASGSASFFAAVLAMRDKVLPPTVGTCRTEETFDTNIVTEAPVSISNGFGVVISLEMSGQNSAFVIGDRP